MHACFTSLAEPDCGWVWLRETLVLGVTEGGW